MGKLYDRLKEAGKKMEAKHFKEAGIEELADMAGDFVTIFDSGASGWVKAQAAVDLIVGTEFNNKGAKDVDKVIDEVKDGVKGVYETTTKKGQKYVGKGDKKRMNQSAKDKSSDEDPNESKTFYGSKNDKNASEEEAIAIRQNGLSKDNPKSQNKIHTGRSKVNKTFGGGKYKKNNKNNDGQ